MKKRQLAKILRSIATGGKVDLAKVKAMPVENAAALTQIIVRQRKPVLIELFERSGFKRSWVSACGYLHQTTGAVTGYTFLHLAGEKIV